MITLEVHRSRQIELDIAIQRLRLNRHETHGSDDSACTDAKMPNRASACTGDCQGRSGGSPSVTILCKPGRQLLFKIECLNN